MCAPALASKALDSGTPARPRRERPGSSQLREAAYAFVAKRRCPSLVGHGRLCERRRSLRGLAREAQHLAQHQARFPLKPEKLGSFPVPDRLGGESLRLLRMPEERERACSHGCPAGSYLEIARRRTAFAFVENLKALRGRSWSQTARARWIERSA